MDKKIRHLISCENILKRWDVNFETFERIAEENDLKPASSSEFPCVALMSSLDSTNYVAAHYSLADIEEIEAEHPELKSAVKKFLQASTKNGFAPDIVLSPGEKLERLLALLWTERQRASEEFLFDDEFRKKVFNETSIKDIAELDNLIDTLVKNGFLDYTEKEGVLFFKTSEKGYNYGLELRQRQNSELLKATKPPGKGTPRNSESNLNESGNASKQIPVFTTARDILKRWNIDYEQFFYIAQKDSLRCEFSAASNLDYSYHLSDIENIEAKYPDLKNAAMNYKKQKTKKSDVVINEEPLSEQERREFAKMKKLRDSLPMYIEAVCDMTSYAVEYKHKYGSQPTKKELQEYLINLKQEYDITLFNKLWQVFPSKYKLSGPPPKKLHA